MREATLDEIYSIASACREEIWDKARELGREPKIYLHWTAGRYGDNGVDGGGLFDDYHISITGQGKLYIATEDFAETLAHTWKRNTGAIGVTLCCGYQSGSYGLGDYPPTAVQIEVMAQVIAKLCKALWLTIDKFHVMTHGEAANNEDGIFPLIAYAWWNDEGGSGDTRGDLEYLGTSESPRYDPYATDGSRGGDVLRGKANWYAQRM